MTDHLPPQNLDAERAVLGALLLGDRDAIDAARSLLVPESFYSTTSRHVWTAICALSDRGGVADVLTVRAEMEKAGTLEQAGGAYAVAQLAGEVGTSANVEYHAALVRDAYLRRSIIVRVSQLQARAYDPSESTEDLLSAAQQVCPDVDTARGETWESVADVVDRAVEAVERAIKSDGAIDGVPTGLADLDEKTNGFQAGDMILVAARPSIGKTAFGLFVAWNASKCVPVGFISAEMGNTALGHRLLAMVSKIDSQAMRRGKLTQDEKDQVGYAAVTIGTRPIYLSDRLREPGQIAREARRLKQQHGIGLLIVDYLQLLEGVKGRKADNREQEVSAISRAIKSTATSLNIPVVALAQLNRKAEDRGDKRPQLSDLRDSGSLEQDADIVILLHRPARYGVLEQAGEDVTHLVEAHIAKQRNGPTGTVRLYFDETTGMFGNWGGKT